MSKVVDYILKNASKLSPEKITALAHVVKAAGEEIEKTPNTVPNKSSEENDIREDAPFDISEVTGVSVDGGKKKKIKIIQQK